MKKIEAIVRHHKLDAIKSWVSESSLLVYQANATMETTDLRHALLGIQVIIESETAKEPEPTPKLPENLKALRESQRRSIDYVNHHLHRTGLVGNIEEYESGNEWFCAGSVMACVLALIYGMDHTRVFAAGQQSVAGSEALSFGTVTTRSIVNST